MSSDIDVAGGSPLPPEKKQQPETHSAPRGKILRAHNSQQPTVLSGDDKRF